MIWNYTTRDLWQLLLKTQTLLELFEKTKNYWEFEKQAHTFWEITEQEISEIWDILLYIDEK